jgi:putative transposase
MSEHWFRRTPGGVLWSPPYFAASVGYALETAVRRFVEHQWDAVAA